MHVSAFLMYNALISTEHDIQNNLFQVTVHIFLFKVQNSNICAPFSAQLFGFYLLF